MRSHRFACVLSSVVFAPLVMTLVAIVPSRLRAVESIPARPTVLSQSLGPRDSLGYWSPDFGLPYFDGDVTDLVLDQGQPVVCGTFGQADGLAVRSSVLRWNGASWAELGLLFGATGLALHQGQLVAVGSLHDGQEYFGCVARWNGARWSRFGPDTIAGQAVAVVSQDSLLAILGTLYLAGEDSVHRLALWNGHEWAVFQNGAASHLNAIALHQGALHTAGYAIEAGVAQVGVVERWDGSAWHVLGDPLRAHVSADVHALEVFAGELYAGGFFFTAGDEEVPSLARWRNGRWEWPHEYPGVFQVRGLEPHGDSLAVLTDHGLYVFDRATLHPASTGLLQNAAMASSGSTLYVAGRKRDYLGVVVRRDADRWTEVLDWTADHHGLDRGAEAVALLDGRLVVGVNTATFAGNGEALLFLGGVSAWDGVRWRLLGDSENWSIRALAVHRGRLVAGGRFEDARNPAIRNLATWDGERWLPIGGGADGIVTALESHGDTLLVGGQFSSVGGTPARFVAAWDGAEWIAMNLDSPGAVVNALAVHAGRVYAGGQFATLDGVANLGEWDGSRWRALSEAPEWVTDLASFRGELIVGTASYAKAILRAWNGSSWRDLDLLGSRVAALAVWGEELVVAGTLYRGGPRTYGTDLLAYDGVDWRAFRGGLDGGVTQGGPEALAAAGNVLAVGGHFTHAGGVSAFGVAQWIQSETMPGPRPLQVTLSLVGPNPFASTIGFDFGLPIPGRVRIKVYDVQGRECAVLQDGVRRAGTHRVTWDGRDRDGRRVPPGVYLARLEAERATVTRRFVHVP